MNHPSATSCASAVTSAHITLGHLIIGTIFACTTTFLIVWVVRMLWRDRDYIDSVFARLAISILVLGMVGFDVILITSYITAWFDYFA